MIVASIIPMLWSTLLFMLAQNHLIERYRKVYGEIAAGEPAGPGTAGAG